MNTLTWNCALCDSETLPFVELDENEMLLTNLGINNFVSNDVNLVPDSLTNKFAVDCENICDSILNDNDTDHELIHGVLIYMEMKALFLTLLRLQIQSFRILLFY